MPRKTLRAHLILVAATLALAGCVTPTSPAPPAAPQQTPSLPADLPADADRSDVARQLAFLARGLYLTLSGEVRALPAKYAKASWSAGPKAPPSEKADQQTEERVHILLEEGDTK